MAKIHWILAPLLAMTVAMPAWANPPAAAAFARTRANAERVLQELRRTNPDVDANWHPAVPGAALVVGLRAATRGADATARALQFARDHAALWGVASRQVQLVGSATSRDRHTVHLGLAVQVGSRAVPVLDRRLTITLDRAGGQVLSAASDLFPVESLRAASVGERAAAERAVQAVGLCEGAANCAEVGRASPARLAVLADVAGATPVWVVDVQAAGPLQRTAVLVDAWTGAAVRATPIAVD